MMDSFLFVSYANEDLDFANPTNAFTGGSFVLPDLLLKSVTITSSSNGFASSFIAAPIIGNARFGSVTTDNGGTLFGVLVGQSMTLLTVRTPPFKWNRFGRERSIGGRFSRYQMSPAWRCS